MPLQQINSNGSQVTPYDALIGDPANLSRLQLLFGSGRVCDALEEAFPGREGPLIVDDASKALNFPEFVRRNVADVGISDVKRLYQNRESFFASFPALAERFPADSTRSFDNLSLSDLNFLTQTLYSLISPELLESELETTQFALPLLSLLGKLLNVASSAPPPMTLSPSSNRPAVDMLELRSTLAGMSEKELKDLPRILANGAANASFSVGQLFAVGTDSLLVVTNYAYAANNVNVVTLVNPATKERYVLFREIDPSLDPLTKYLPSAEERARLAQMGLLGSTDILTFLETTHSYRELRWIEPLDDWRALEKLTIIGTGAGKAIARKLAKACSVTPSANPDQTVTLYDPSSHTRKTYTQTGKCFPHSPEPAEAPSPSIPVVAPLPSIWQMSPEQLKGAKPNQRLAYAVGVSAQFVLGLIAFIPAMMTAAIVCVFSRETAKNISAYTRDAVMRLPHTLFWLAHGLPTSEST